jgi:antitoxin HicB
LAEGIVAGGPETGWDGPADTAVRLADRYAACPANVRRIVGIEKQFAEPPRSAVIFCCWRSSAGFGPCHRKEDAKDAGWRFGYRKKAAEGADTMNLNNAQIGSPVEDWLEEEGILQEATLLAVKKVIAWQLSEEMRLKNITKVRMAELMQTSRAQLDRILNPLSNNTTIETLQRAANIVGRELRVELV